MPAPPAASPVPMLVISLHRPHVPCTLLHPLPTVTKRHRLAADVATRRRPRHGARGLGRGLQLGPKRLWGREGGGQGRGQRWKSLEGGEAEGVSYCRRALLSVNCSAAVVRSPAALGKGRRSSHAAWLVLRMRRLGVGCCAGPLDAVQRRGPGVSFTFE